MMLIRFKRAHFRFCRKPSSSLDFGVFTSIIGRVLGRLMTVYRFRDAHRGCLNCLAALGMLSCFLSHGCEQKERPTSLIIKKERDLTGHAGAVNRLAVSGDGNLIASAGDDKTIRIWDGRSGEFQRVLNGHADGILGLAFSPAGRSLASASKDRTVRIWDADTGKEVQTLKDGDVPFQYVTFSKDGKLLAACGARNISVWEFTSGKPSRLRHVINDLLTPCGCVEFVPGEKLVAANSGVTIGVWELESGARRREALYFHGQNVSWFKISPGAKFVSAIGVSTSTLGGSVKIWNHASHEETVNLEFPTRVGAAEFSPDSSLLATGGVEQPIRLWRSSDGKEFARTEESTGTCRSLVFSRDGRRLISASEDGVIRVWSVPPE
jgi:WD40 repeat protein